MPVFAALDGTVTAVHDGEFDQNTTNLAGRPANYVRVTHTGGACRCASGGHRRGW